MIVIKNCIRLLVLLFVFTKAIYSQIDTIDNNINLQSLIEESSYDNNSQLHDILETQINNSLDINTATFNQLIQIPFLNTRTAKSIIDYRNSIGKFNSLLDLYKIEDINKETIEKIIPFLKVDHERKENNFTLREILSTQNINYRSRLINDFQTARGYFENKFVGSKQKFYNRLLLQSKNVYRAGILFEKDPGENSLVDFYSFHIEFNNISFLSDIIIGDYLINFGQGLALSNPYNYSKSIDATNFVNRNFASIKPYSSTDENRFMRGIAFNINLGSFKITPFYSNNFLDASIDSISYKINSFIEDGYHRTEKEISKKNNVNEKISGIIAEYLLNDCNKIEFLFYNSKFNYELNENIFANSSKSNNYYSVSYNLLIKQLNLSGEIAYHKSLLAHINNIFFNINKNISLIFSLRNYPENFFSIHGNSFGEKSTVQNETGFYTGLKLSTRYGNINFYHDIFKYRDVSNITSYPLKGNELLIYYDCILTKKLKFMLKYKFKKKYYESVTYNTISLSPTSYKNIRFDFLYRLSRNINYRTRIEYVYLQKNSSATNEKGLLHYEDIIYIINKFFQINGRIVFFRTDSYDSRIYEYENDLMGIITIPALYGEGMRWYIMLKYRTRFGLILTLKYSELFKPNEKSLSSGYNQISNNIDNSISLQLDFKF